MDNILLKTIDTYFDDEIVYENVTILSNASAIIYQLFPNINWVGFYLFLDNTLKLGPFQGKPACMEININNGVCGWCARNLKSIVVDDVHQFEGHIACDNASNSELVIPIIIDNKLFGLLDIDSPLFSRFSADDLELFENIVQILIKKLQKK